ncbi:hypothetical protein B0T17DRAFT_308251 [Bombardia bombarda]|uniref:Rho-GAP domain-containing protein n=1 Tax=Bombardia bombarda TaxID=252184 RepID=A0AA39WV16_9PEZI|nr:hypothetical protein B0T17DRAFT_308251 [Bombardia bombarda]
MATILVQFTLRQQLSSALPGDHQVQDWNRDVQAASHTHGSASSAARDCYKPPPPLHPDLPDLPDLDPHQEDADTNADVDADLLDPTLSHQQRYMRALIKYSEGGMREVVDDIDATTDDSDETGGEDGNNRKDPRGFPSGRERRRKRGSRSRSRSLSGLSVTPRDGSLQVSHRISRIPYTQQGGVPELMPDQEDLVSPSTPHAMPTTPNPVDEPVQSLSFASIPKLELPTFTDSDTDGEAVRVRSRRSSEPADALSMIREEDEPLPPIPTGHTSGKYSLDMPRGRGTTKRARDYQEVSLASSTRSVRSVLSVSSLETTTTNASSSGGQPRNSSLRSQRQTSGMGLFSRLRNSVRSTRNMAEEEFIEKRSLTPYELSMSTEQKEREEAGGDTTPVPPLPHHAPPPPPSSSAASNAYSRPFSSAESTRKLKKPKRLMRLRERDEPDEGPTKGSVFGMDLSESIRVAPMRIRISHKGRSTSYRTFPISVYKCIQFIRSKDCADATLFSNPGDAFNVAELKSIFTTGPDYGESFSFTSTDYTVYDAARLITIYLSELPKPLVSNSVLKSWVLLARQQGAIEPPCPQRIDMGLDFWAEALNRLPMANRNLVKELLNMFAEILMPLAQSATDAAGPNKSTVIKEADARHFSAAISRALFHSDETQTMKNAVHPTLALAFIIGERGKYLDSLGASNKGKRESNMFLPSTKEMMQWKKQ